MSAIAQIEDGFGVSSMAELEELKKALSVGYTNPPTGADSIRVESLDTVLKLVTFQAQHAKLWNMIPKNDASSTVEEYNLLNSYGTENSGFVDSGELPEETDSDYERKTAFVRYIGTTRSVHHPATLIKSVPADLIAQETQNGALWIIGAANRALYFGNGDAIPTQFNGLPKQIEDNAGIVIDCLGAPITSQQLEDAARQVAESFGFLTKLFAPPKVLADFSASFGTYQRFLAPDVKTGRVGTPVSGYNSLNGPIDFEQDVFIKGGKVVAPASATHIKAPTAPTVGSFVVGADTDPTNVFLAGDAGNYKYQITAINKFGESAPCALSAAQGPTTGQKVDFTITDGGGTYPATGYKIYRTTKGGATAYLIRTIARGANQAATTTFTDRNLYRADTYQALGLDMTPQSLMFKQLAPMLKMDLAVISPAIRWMQLLYGMPIMYQPKRNVWFKNIGYTP